MTIVLQVFKWIWRAWPLLMITVTLAVQWMLLVLMPSYSETINKTVALVLQIIGGLLVLYSIDSNIGVIRGRSLITELCQYLAEFPLMKRSHTLEVKGVSGTASLGKARPTVTRNPQTVDERLNYLQEQINKTRRDLQEEISDLEIKFQKKNHEIDKRIGSLSTSVKQVESTVVEVSVGGIKIQVFGVLLLVYGAFSGYVA